MTIEVANRGGVAAAIQLRAFAWSQAGDRDVLSPTHDIIMSPPIFTLAKDGSQTIRLMLRRGSGATGERTYRLLIDEVPASDPKAQQVQVAMRLSLPIIVGSPASRASSLHWRATRGANGQIMLSAINRGRAFERVQSIAVTGQDGRQHAGTAIAANSYILAGAERRWTVPAVAGGRDLRFSVTTRTGTSEQVLAIAQ